MNKKSLELSIKAIVPVILGIVMLSLALTFVSSMFSKKSANVEYLARKEPNPILASTQQTFTLSRNTLKLTTSEITVIKFSVFNYAQNLVSLWNFDEGRGKLRMI